MKRPSPDQVAGCARFGCGGLLGGLSACLTIMLSVIDGDWPALWGVLAVAASALFCGAMAWRFGDRYIDRLIGRWTGK